jgi:hypothetical protein
MQHRPLQDEHPLDAAPSSALRQLEQLQQQQLQQLQHPAALAGHPAAPALAPPVWQQLPQRGAHPQQQPAGGPPVGTGLPFLPSGMPAASQPLHRAPMPPQPSAQPPPPQPSTSSGSPSRRTGSAAPGSPTGTVEVHSDLSDDKDLLARELGLRGSPLQFPASSPDLQLAGADVDLLLLLGGGSPAYGLR